jgi:hypothetical protein
MAEPTANPLEGPPTSFRYITTASPSPAMNEVETELRRLARQRLTPTSEGEAPPSQHRISLSLRRRHQPLVGAFDSPQGFAFAAGGTSRRR